MTPLGKHFFVLFLIIILSICLIATVVINYSQNGTSKSKPFYIGVTFCGNSTADAKLLIDKVKNYTNLFVLQSGLLQVNATAINEIGDYAISSGLYYSVYIGTSTPTQQASWLSTASLQWGKKFLGVYYGDEPGGKMLDAYLDLSEKGDSEQITKLANGGLSVQKTDSNVIYYPDGRIIVSKWANSDLTANSTEVENNTEPIWEIPGLTPNSAEAQNSTELNSYHAMYYPNGTTTVYSGGNFFTSDNGTYLLSQIEQYENLLHAHPFPNASAAAKKFINANRDALQWLANESFSVFTSDYALYWFDYLSGYDTVFAQLGWNNTVIKEIALVRGAANLQNKSWGTILTWKYTEEPYLPNGEEMYNELQMSYESGATYVIVFNYSENMEGPYGTLQDEHFEALEYFWTEVVQNTQVIHGGIEVQAVLVLPNDCGWGIRSLNDTIWGIWNANSTSEQIWVQIQEKIKDYGLRIDIVYEDPNYPVEGRFQNVYYWNQTDTSLR
jgi:hypothetical protein